MIVLRGCTGEEDDCRLESRAASVPRGWLVCVGGDPTRASPSCPLVAQLTCRNKLIEKSDELISKEEIQASFRSDLRVPCP